MELPEKHHPVKDVRRNITVDVVAYRDLTEEEAKRVVRIFLAKNRVKPNCRYEVQWLADAGDPC